MGVGIKIPYLDQFGNEIQVYYLDNISEVDIVIDSEYNQAPEKVPNMRDPDADFFNVGSGWGKGGLCERQIMG